ncbi:unnamed protein product [Paramecium sonneborni]|uniref:Uncharacterized protein n=1 Tax=Paramecium sonneborni TaxID=65129 RepID=A0A8S1R6Y8_9CILI|nr:unnamed protein product [Paramecium sonneborni]
MLLRMNNAQYIIVNLKDGYKEHVINAPLTATTFDLWIIEFLVLQLRQLNIPIRMAIVIITLLHVQQKLVRHTQNITINYSNCNNWLSSCIVGTPTSCIQKPFNCADYVNYDQHYEIYNSNYPFTWVDDAFFKRTFTNHGFSVTVFNQADRNNWPSSYTVNPDILVVKNPRTYTINDPIFNHNKCTNGYELAQIQIQFVHLQGQNIIFFTHDTYNSWLLSCTFSWDKFGCETKTCTNYGQQITTFNNSNCQSWFSDIMELLVSQLKIVHQEYLLLFLLKIVILNNVQQIVIQYQYQYQYTYQSGSYCTNKTCSSQLHTQQFSFSGLQMKTCYHHRASISYFTHESYDNWLFYCTVNSFQHRMQIKNLYQRFSMLRNYNQSKFKSYSYAINKFQKNYRLYQK